VYYQRRDGLSSSKSTMTARSVLVFILVIRIYKTNVNMIPSLTETDLLEIFT